MKKPRGAEAVAAYEALIARKKCPRCDRPGLKVGPFYSRDRIRCPNPPGCGAKFRLKFDEE